MSILIIVIVATAVDSVVLTVLVVDMVIAIALKDARYRYCWFQINLAERHPLACAHRLDLSIGKCKVCTTWALPDEVSTIWTLPS